jgi:hypothetical protein
LLRLREITTVQEAHPLSNAARTAVVAWLMTAVNYLYQPAPIAAHEEL